ncbi:hypothetical protein BAUCODRAFT_571091 [Baudoinia panamericana UAMH 10762]|uniref:Major facilitator superfamily (MFS) profile domain-containing protein n=1 Tax=Baudoinia panamericana (strain UAMH 10762) TaxID=717646 RepID=M2MJ83_BAUPA|nr:uncharacterized protein BAUCODRAFT_571091 [Baudoinia panamericana UAMH 10762]EMC91338.1 hypothetical protein BAUCODRAFT_571091 [Baudoinia panamericana UAMH 10762]
MHNDSSLEKSVDLDQAHDFLANHVQNGPASDADIEHLTRTIDCHIMPILFSVYFVQALDKQLLNYAAVMGLTKDLHLASNDFSNLATYLFVALIIAEVPTVYILNKVPVVKWLSINAYYRKDHQGSRFLLWRSAIGLDVIIGGLLSFAFQHVHNAALASWKILFLLLGCLSIAFGLCLFVCLPDTPMHAKFLSDQQKVALLHHISVNKTGVRATTFRLRQVVDFLRDPQIWLLTIATILTTISTGVTLSYSSQLIAGFGFSPKQAALLNMPSGAVTIVAAFVIGGALNTRLPRCFIIASGNLVAIIVACLVGFAPSHKHAALLAGIYLVNITSPVLFTIYQWASANVAGHSKRTMTMALITMAFSAGSLIGPQTFRAKDKPEYRPAKIALIATQAGCAFLCCVLGAYYSWTNKRRDAKYGEETVLGDSSGSADDVKTWENLTDIERTSFRYMT